MLLCSKNMPLLKTEAPADWLRRNGKILSPIRSTKLKKYSLRSSLSLCKLLGFPHYCPSLSNDHLSALPWYFLLFCWCYLDSLTEVPLEEGVMSGRFTVLFARILFTTVSANSENASRIQKTSIHRRFYSEVFGEPTFVSHPWKALDACDTILIVCSAKKCAVNPKTPELFDWRHPFRSR